MTITMQQYLANKPSGVEWPVEIPSHWEVRAISQLCSIGRGRVISKIEIDDHLGEYPVYSSQTEDEGIFGYLDSYDFDGEYLTWTTDGANAGTVFHRTGRFNCTNVCGTLKARSSDVDLSFLSFALSVVTRRYVRLDINPKLMNNVMAKIRVMLPLVPEQQAIAAFLDRKTQAIDSIIQKKERLITLLQEKRQALITRAVTKGLDPTVPMKDSGIEWLGEIPAHWSVLPLRRVVSRIEQGWSPIAEDRLAIGEEWAVVKLSAVSKGAFRMDEHKALTSDTIPEKRFEIRFGDLLLTRSNTPDLVGDTCVVKDNCTRLMLCDLIYRISPNDGDLVSKYAAYWLLSCVGRYQIMRDARGSSGSMVKISQGHIYSWPIALPPTPEQNDIVNCLDEEIARHDSLIAKIRLQLDKVREYRQTLISAAVTGKIDVREEFSV